MDRGIKEKVLGQNPKDPIWVEKEKGQDTPRILASAIGRTEKPFTMRRTCL